MNNPKNQRVAALIDAENVEIQARVYGARFYYEKLLQELSDRELIRILYFKPYDKLTKGWEQVLTDLSFEVKTTPRNSDSWLIIAAVALAEKCDTIVLIGGDADYVPLISYLQAKGVKCEVWCWPQCTSIELRKLADRFFPFTAEFLMGQPGNVLTLTTNRR